jgi:hypothetical protein
MIVLLIGLAIFIYNFLKRFLIAFGPLDVSIVFGGPDLSK